MKIRTAVQIALACGATWTAVACGGGGSGVAQAEVGRRAPTFVAPRLDGRGEVRLTDFRGKPVLVNFFASWCTPCRDELPLLQRTYDGKKAVVIGVLFRDSKSNAEDFLRGLHVTIPAVEDDGGIAHAYRVGLKPGLPITFAISTKGTLVARHIGQLRASDIPALLRAAA